MPITNPAALHLIVPDYPLDQIIGYFTGTVTVSAPTVGPPDFGIKTVITPIPHGFGDSCYFQGVFSTDNGATFNDFGSMIPDLSNPSLPIFQTFGCTAYIDTTNVNIIMSNYGGSAETAIYKIFLIAKNTMAKPINPLPTNQILSFSSIFNFQQIAFKGQLTLNVASGAVGSVSFIHNLGYIPFVRAFWFDASTPTVCNPMTYSPNSSPNQVAAVDNPQVQLTSQLLTIYADETFGGPGLNGIIGYRIYLGNGS